MVDTSRLNDAGGPSGPRGRLWGIPWGGWLLVLLAMAVAGVFLVDMLNARSAASSPWVDLGSPPTSAGGAHLWGRCDGPTRVYVVTGPDGAPVGPPTVVTFEQGSGCAR